jgi:hypothetical protein
MRTEIPSNIHHRKPKGRPWSIIMSKSMQSSLYDDNIKINNEPMYDKKYLLLRLSHVWGMVLYGGDNESNKTFKLQK